MRIISILADKIGPKKSPENLSADFVSADKKVGDFIMTHLLTFIGRQHQQNQSNNQSAAFPISADNRPRKIEHVLFEREKVGRQK